MVAGRAAPAPPIGPGRPPDFNLRRLFHILADVFEDLTESIYSVPVDPGDGQAYGPSLDWTVQILSADPDLRQWVQNRPGGVVAHIKSARWYNLGLAEVEIFNLTFEEDLARAVRPKWGGRAT